MGPEDREALDDFLSSGLEGEDESEKECSRMEHDTLPQLQEQRYYIHISIVSDTSRRRRSKGRNCYSTPPAGYVSVVALDRKSTRLNSSHTVISYAVFCLIKIKSN